MKKPEASDLLIPVLLSLVVLLVSSLIARALEQLTTRQFLLGFAATVVILLVQTGLFFWLKDKAHQREFRSAIAQLRELIPPSDFPWLYSDAELAKAESEVERSSSIWIVSPDLMNVTEKEVIIDAVKKNIKQRVKYTYIVPNTKDVRGVVAGLNQLFSSHQNQLDIVWVPEEEFFLRSITHYAIINPDRKDGHSPVAYLELPIVDVTGKKIRGHWIKVSKAATAGLIGRFLEVIERHGGDESV